MRIRIFYFQNEEEKKMQEQKTDSTGNDANSTIQKIRVKTAFGTLIASKSENPDNPGIYICIEQTDKDGDMYEQDIVLVEDTAGSPIEGFCALRVVTWEDMNSEDYTRVVQLSEKRGESP